MATEAAAVGARARERVRGSFFFWISIVLLAFLVVGFSPTLYLRPAFDVQPIPGYLYVHGAVLTAWFVWLVIQTSMIRSGRVTTHRKLGVAGALLAIAVCFAGPMASIGVVSRIANLGVDFSSDMSVAAPELGVEGVTVIRFVSGVFWGNFTSIIIFAGFVAAAVLLRRNTETHKRLMVLASISIVGPALARISRIPVFGGEDGPFTMTVMLSLLVAVLAHDFVVRRRPYVVSVIGIGILILLGMIGTRIAASELGMSVVRSLA
jgi:hypothetical protein